VAKVTMPQLGESVAEGTIGRWLKKPGDRVEKYEPIVEVVTDKVNAEVPSPFAGILTAILAEEGATVPNNAEIAEIETSEVETMPAPATAVPAVQASTPAAAAAPAQAAAAAPAGAPAATAPNAASTDAAPTPTPRAEAPQAPLATPTAAGVVPSTLPEAGEPDARMTPAVRRLLREHGLSAAQVPGTGGGGRITRDDVLAVVETIRTGGTAPAIVAPAGPTAAPAAAPATFLAAGTPAPSARPAPASTGPVVVFPPGADEVLVPMTKMRKGIAAQMTRALLVPHAYVHVEVDVTNLVRLRDSAKRDYQAREGIPLSYVPFVMKAVVEALRRQPTFNATWTDEGLLARRRVNLGVAVAVDDGLIVPIVRDVDQLSINGINRAVAELAVRARANRFRTDDFGGGTFTVDNTGWFGSNLTMPIINVPEVAILTMEAITKRPVVLETPQGDVIAIRPVMNMVIGIDHRANDGAQAGFFLRDVKAWLEGIGPDTPIY
jgi:2-oxoisovalerate dehydrogenase E2 component (dihydrolipoyl transacylase)